MEAIGLIVGIILSVLGIGGFWIGYIRNHQKKGEDKATAKAEIDNIKEEIKDICTNCREHKGVLNVHSGAINELKLEQHGNNIQLKAIDAKLDQTQGMILTLQGQYHETTRELIKTIKEMGIDRRKQNVLSE